MDDLHSHMDICSSAKPHKCISCGEMKYSKTTRSTKPNVCHVCYANGITFCRKCGKMINARDNEKKYCIGCNPVPETSIWRTWKAPLGGLPITETRSWRSFGVEIECYYASAFARKPKETPRNWEKGSDVSLRAPENSETSEFRSPPFFGDLGLKEMSLGIMDLRKQGYRANRSTGLHVHVDAQGLSDEDLSAIRKFARWYQIEIFDLVVPSRRVNMYCQQLTAANIDERRTWLNFEALKEFRTLEFRLHHGTTHAKRIREWVRICLLFIEQGLRLGRKERKPEMDLFAVLQLEEDQKEYWRYVVNKLSRLPAIPR